MLIVINRGPGELELSTRAYERLIELGVNVFPPDEIANHDVEEFVIYDMSKQDGMVISDDPDDAATADAWMHSDYRYACYALNFVEQRGHPMLVNVVKELGAAAGAPGCHPVLWDVPAEKRKSFVLLRDGAGWEVVAWPSV